MRNFISAETVIWPFSPRLSDRAAEKTIWNKKVSNLSFNKASGDDEELLHAKRILEDFFGKPISIKKRGQGGKIEIGFTKKEDLKDILEKLV